MENVTDFTRRRNGCGWPELADGNQLVSRMNASCAHPMTAWILAGCGLFLVTLQGARADEDVTAVTSKVVSKDYVRTKLPDGSYQQEAYFLKNGGRYDKPSGDASMDNKSFPDIARVIVEQLGIQNYRPGTDPRTGKLIIVVFWGTTIPRDSTALFEDTNNFSGLGSERANGSPRLSAELDFYNTLHLHDDATNAGLLGYDLEKIHEAPAMFGLFLKDQELLNELEGERYFVVLMAYDCQEFLRRKKYKELWETRFSVSTSNTDFTKALPKMAKDASGYFGRDSHGLQQLPEGRVNVGETKSLGEVEAPQK
jgi:hypothetical protein